MVPDPVNTSITISDFIGIIGAIAGSTITLITTELVKRSGKIINYSKDYSYVYGKKSEQKMSYASDLMEYFRLSFELQVFNSSQIPKIMYDIKLDFMDNKQILFSKDLLERWQGNQIEYLNIVAKTFIKYSVSCYLDCSDNDYFKLPKINGVFLSYNNERGKRKKFKIFSQKFVKETLKSN